MKKKKIVIGLSLLIGISLFSVGAKAQTLKYTLQMPARGYVDSEETATKADTSKRAYNTVDSLGWVQKGDSFHWWIVTQGGKQLTDTAGFFENGRFSTPYKGSNGNDYVGYELNIRMKSDLITNHPCDVEGKFTP